MQTLDEQPKIFILKILLDMLFLVTIHQIDILNSYLSLFHLTKKYSKMNNYPSCSYFVYMTGCMNGVCRWKSYVIIAKTAKRLCYAFFKIERCIAIALIAAIISFYKKRMTSGHYFLFYFVLSFFTTAIYCSNKNLRLI